MRMMGRSGHDTAMRIYVEANMATRLSVTVNTGASKNDGETRRAECQNAIDVLALVAVMLQNTQGSGVVFDRNGVSHSYTYTPTASA